MEQIYMAMVYYTNGEKLLDVEVHGAFSSYRTASDWLINEGFEVYYDSDATELFEEYTIGFCYLDEVNEQYAIIEEFKIHR